MEDKVGSGVMGSALRLISLDRVALLRGIIQALDKMILPIYLSMERIPLQRVTLTMEYNRLKRGEGCLIRCRQDKRNQNYLKI